MLYRKDHHRMDMESVRCRRHFLIGKRGADSRSCPEDEVLDSRSCP